MHIAIEGMDGVGKTTAARLLGDQLGFRVVEKTLGLPSGRAWPALQLCKVQGLH